MARERKDLRWLVLVHAIPPSPNYLRIKVGRRLQKIGAVPIKNSVYLLPLSEQACEDFAWVAKEIQKEGGEASVLEASFVEGLSDSEAKALFQSARDVDYREIAAELRKLGGGVRGRIREEHRKTVESELARFRKRIDEITFIDFFSASGREAVEGLLNNLETRLQSHGEIRKETSLVSKLPSAATWVTRTGIHVDRMASAWIIQRFVDSKAKFRFISPRNYRHRAGELRFDMFDGEYTHEGDDCTFEVLQRRFQLDDPALTQIAQIVHDIDLKDQKFGRPDVVGVERLIAGIAMAHPQDEARLSRASAVFDDLYVYFQRKR